MRSTHGLRRIVVAMTVLGSLITMQPHAYPAVGEATRSPASRGALIFSDEFTASGLDTSRWNRCHWWAPTGCTIAGNNELEWYTPGQVEQRDGSLRLTAARSPMSDSTGKRFDYRSGMVTTGSVSARGSEAKFAFRYGYLEARVSVPHGVGLWPALWLLPTTNRSLPEVDIFEIRGSQTNALSMHLHTLDRNGEEQSAGEHWNGPDLAVGWHVFGLEWKPRSLRWLVDGHEAWNVVGDKVPSEPMYIVANLAVGGDWPGPPTPATPFPATFAMDYIRVWGHRP
jgi:beta-glucanase (GH16 family)